LASNKDVDHPEDNVKTVLTAALAGIGALAMTIAAPTQQAQALPNNICTIDGTVCSGSGTVTLTPDEFAFFYGEAWKNRNVTRWGLVGRERPLKSYGSSPAAWHANPEVPTGGGHKTRELHGLAVAKNGYFSASGWTWRENNPWAVGSATNLVQQWEAQGKIVLPNQPPGTVPQLGQDMLEVLYNPYDSEFANPDYLLDMLFLGGLRTKTIGEIAWYTDGRQTVAYNNRIYYRLVAKIYTPLQVTYARIEPTCNLSPFAIVAPGATVDISAAVTSMNCRAPSGSPLHIRWDPFAQNASFGRLGVRADGSGLTYRAFYTLDEYDPSSPATDGRKDTFAARLISDDQSIDVNIPIEAHITNRPQCTDRPVATVKRGTSIVIPLSQLCTDTDAILWGETLEFDQTHAPGGTGRIEFLTNPPAIRYTPPATYTGPDQFTIRAKDALGSLSKPATLKFTIVHPELICANLTKPSLPPVHHYENWVPVDVSINCALENGAPTMGTPITFQIGQPSHGTLSNVNPAAGTFTYLATDPNAHPFDAVRVIATWADKSYAGYYRLAANCGVRACDPPPPTE
jgi:hypothetical protein